MAPVDVEWAAKVASLERELKFWKISTYFWCGMLCLQVISMVIWKPAYDFYNENKANNTCLRALERVGHYKNYPRESINICEELSKLSLGE